jgi:hypothetical protein
MEVSGQLHAAAAGPDEYKNGRATELVCVTTQRNEGRKISLTLPGVEPRPLRQQSDNHTQLSCLLSLSVR